jgi:hypothetical protein
VQTARLLLKWLDGGSYQIETVYQAIDLLAENPKFQSYASKACRKYRYCDKGKLFVNNAWPVPCQWRLKPWAISTQEELNGLDGVFKPNALESLQGDRLKIHEDRFSATAFSLSWLSSLATPTRLQLRKLILDEDKETNPPASEQLNGIIQPCTENPALHVETRTDVQLVDNIVSRIGINSPRECQLLWHVEV